MLLRNVKNKNSVDNLKTSTKQLNVIFGPYRVSTLIQQKLKKEKPADKMALGKMTL